MVLKKNGTNVIKYQGGLFALFSRLPVQAPDLRIMEGCGLNWSLKIVLLEVSPDMPGKLMDIMINDWKFVLDTQRDGYYLGHPLVVIYI